MSDQSSVDKSPNLGDRRLNQLLEELKALLANESNHMRQKWNRSLPFGDYISDRWLKAESLGFGSGASIYDSTLIIGNVSVGEQTWVGPFTILDGSGGLTIGSTCSISAGVQIYTHDTVNWALSGGEAEPEKASVVIGDRCYIGPNSIIAKGVVVGEGSVIGANSLVNSDIPPGSKAWGSPCKVQGRVD